MLGGIAGRGHVGVVLEGDGGDLELREAWISEQRPFAALDVDLQEVHGGQAREDVDGGHGDAAAIGLDARVREVSGREAQLAVLGGRARRDDGVAVRAVCLGGGAQHFQVRRVGLVEVDRCVRECPQQVRPEEPDVRTEVRHPQGAAKFAQRGHNWRWHGRLLLAEGLLERGDVRSVVAQVDDRVSLSDVVAARRRPRRELVAREACALTDQRGQPGGRSDALNKAHRAASIESALVASRSDRLPLHVGLDLIFLGGRAGGVGRHGWELPPALLAAEPDLLLTCFVGSAAPPELFETAWADHVRWIRFPVAATSRVHLLAQFAAMPAVAAARRIDVLHSLANAGPWWSPRVARVLTLHDLLFLTQGADWNPDARARKVTAALALGAARRADRVIAVSEFAARQLAEIGQIDPGHIDVVPGGAPETSRAAPTPEADVRARLGIGAVPFVLCVAQKRRYKNQGALVRALARLPPPLKLVLPGAPTSYEAELRLEAERMGVADRVCLVDWVSEADLETLYAASSCVVLPSLEEGFGLPVLEAMVRGVPVVCSDNGAMAEVAGDAALLVDPNDDGAIARAVEHVLGDPAVAADLTRRGQGRAAAFSWRRAAEGTLAVYRRALAQRRSSSTV